MQRIKDQEDIIKMLYPYRVTHNVAMSRYRCFCQQSTIITPPVGIHQSWLVYKQIRNDTFLTKTHVDQKGTQGAQTSDKADSPLFYSTQYVCIYFQNSQNIIETCSCHAGASSTHLCIYYVVQDCCQHTFVKIRKLIIV